MSKGAKGVETLNPDPYTRLVGEGNYGKILLNGIEYTALIDTGAQISTMGVSTAHELNLEIRPLSELLRLEATGGTLIPYFGYVEVNLKLKGVRGYDEDVLFYEFCSHL